MGPVYKNMFDTMEPKRYWWMLSYSKVEDRYWEEVTPQHPFNTIRLANDDRKWQLVSWQIISVEEYNLWNELNNKG